MDVSAVVPRRPSLLDSEYFIPSSLRLPLPNLSLPNLAQDASATSPIHDTSGPNYVLPSLERRHEKIRSQLQELVQEHEQGEQAENDRREKAKVREDNGRIGLEEHLEYERIRWKARKKRGRFMNSGLYGGGSASGSVGSGSRTWSGIGRKRTRDELEEGEEWECCGSDIEPGPEEDSNGHDPFLPVNEDEPEESAKIEGMPEIPVEGTHQRLALDLTRLIASPALGSTAQLGPPGSGPPSTRHSPSGDHESHGSSESTNDVVRGHDDGFLSRFSEPDDPNGEDFAQQRDYLTEVLLLPWSSNNPSDISDNTANEDSIREKVETNVDVSSEDPISPTLERVSLQGSIPLPPLEVPPSFETDRPNGSELRLVPRVSVLEPSHLGLSNGVAVPSITSRPSSPGRFSGRNDAFYPHSIPPSTIHNGGHFEGPTATRTMEGINSATGNAGQRAISSISTSVSTPVQAGTYPCPDCGREFGRRPDLTRHLTVHASNPKPHLCPACGKTFSRKDSMRRHFGATKKTKGSCPGMRSGK